jgi:dethiobiotin synthetase
MGYGVAVSTMVISGTGTEVGKTIATAALAVLAMTRGARVAIVKPAQTGVPDVAEPGAQGDLGDLAQVRRLSGVADLHEYARYPDPLSPAAAARRSGRASLDPTDTATRIERLADERELVLVEGAGGLLVRYDEDGTTVADLARRLGAQVLLVVAAGLGTLNHTALSLEVMANRGIEPAGVVIGEWPERPGLAARSNIRDLETLAARPLAGALPAGMSAMDPVAFAAAARSALSPALGGVFDAAEFRHRFAPEQPGDEGLRP